MSLVPDFNGLDGNESFEPIDGLSSAMWALACAANHFGMRLEGALTAAGLAKAPRTTGLADVVDIAKSLGLSASTLEHQEFADLAAIPRPALLRLRSGEYVLLGKSGLHDASVLQFGRSTPLAIGEPQLTWQWTGEVLLIHGPLRTSTATARPFDLRWFIPIFRRHRHTLWQVLLMTVFLHLCGLIVPLFIQVIIDRVLTYYSQATLAVAMVGLAFASLFKVTLDYLRTYALEDLSRRLDIELGSYGLRRALQLPLEYFARAPTGQIISRVREVDTIRNFLTGSGVTALFDLMMAALMLGVLLSYSVPLTLVTLASTCLHILIMTVNRRLFGKAAHARLEASALSDQILLEALTGVGAIKAATIESVIAERWDRSLVSRASAALRESLLMARSRSLHEYLGSLTSAVLLLLGANLVMQGTLTVGQLLAFHMMTSLIGSPLGRLSHIGQELQQIKASLARFSDVVNTPAETQPNVRQHSLVPIKGDIRFERVFFRYAKESSDVLQGVSLHIHAGQVIGVIGPTGSGKSTLSSSCPASTYRSRVAYSSTAPILLRCLLDGCVDRSESSRRKRSCSVPRSTRTLRSR